MLFGWFAYEPRSEFYELEPSPTTLLDTVTVTSGTQAIFPLLLAALQISFPDSIRLPGNNIQFPFQTSPLAMFQGSGNAGNSMVGTGPAFREFYCSLFKES